MLTSIAMLLLASAPPATAAAVPAPPETIVEVLVTDRVGKPLPLARVVVAGTADREGDTDAGGHVLFRNMAPGDYTMTVGRTAFVTLQKEFTVPAGRASVGVQAALSPSIAPGSSHRASPITARASGAPRVLSVPDLAEAQLLGRNAVAESLIGCTGLTAAHMLRIDESPNERARLDVDEVLYVVAGEAILGVGGVAKTVGPGWLTVIPRGTTYSLRQKGRRPAILLSVVSGQACAAP